MRKTRVQRRRRNQQRRRPGPSRKLPRSPKVNGGSLPDASGDTTPLAAPESPSLFNRLFGKPESENPPTAPETSGPGTTGLSSEQSDQAAAFESAAAQVPSTISEEGSAAANGGAPAAIAGAPLGVPEHREQADAIDLQPETVAVYIRTTFDFLATYDHPLWRLSGKEVDIIVPPTTPVVNKWLRKLAGDSPYKEELALAIVLLAVLGPRAVARLTLRSENKPKPLEAGTSTPASWDIPVAAKVT